MMMKMSPIDMSREYHRAKLAVAKARGAVLACTACPLSESRHAPTPLTFIGPLDPPPAVCFVGEAPGYEEDRDGEPFVGPSGRLLRYTAKQVGLTHYALVNTISCHPPKNRKPARSELEACTGNLVAQIEAGRAWLVVALGNTALTALTGQTEISKHENATFARFNKIVTAFKHPAFYKRNRNLIPELVDHMSLVAAMANGWKASPPPPPARQEDLDGQVHGEPIYLDRPITLAHPVFGEVMIHPSWPSSFQYKELAQMTRSLRDGSMTASQVRAVVLLRQTFTSSRLAATIRT